MSNKKQTAVELVDKYKFYLGNEQENIKEAKDYLDHPILGSRLKEITFEVLALKENNATRVFGIPDNHKLKSSMTLFASVNNSDDNIFEKVLQKLFKGQFDEKTIDLIKNSKK